MVQEAEKTIRQFYLLPCGLPVYINSSLLEKKPHHLIRVPHFCRIVNRSHDLYIFHHKKSFEDELPQLGVTCRAYLEGTCSAKIPDLHSKTLASEPEKM